MLKNCDHCGKKGCYNKCIRRKAYYEENKEKEAACTKAWREVNKERYITCLKMWRGNNKEKEAARKKEHYEANKANYISKSRARRQNMTLRILPGDEVALQNVYSFRDRLNSIIVNVKYTVDHIIPLKHELVSGLHVSWNLQVIPQPDNDAKNNKWDGTYDNRGWNNEGVR